MKKIKKYAKNTARPAYRAYRKIRPNTDALSAVVRSRRMEKAATKALEDNDIDAVQRNLKQIVEEAWNDRFTVSVLQRVKHIEAYKTQIAHYQESRDARSKKSPHIVVYTAISNDYDALKLPEQLDTRFDYVVFTDKPIIDSGIFDVRPMTYFNEDPTRTARYYKTHPHQLLGEYDIAIWVDASVMISGDLYPIVRSFIDSKKDIGVIPHPLRNSVSEEVAACIQLGKEDGQLMEHQLNQYVDSGYGETPLAETGCMMFNLGHDKTHTLLNNWWSEIDRWSRRDQLSLAAALQISKATWHELMKRPNGIRNHPAFILVPHGPVSNSLMRHLHTRVSTEKYDPYAQQPFSEAKKDVVASQMSKRVEVIVCVHNAREAVERCLVSIDRFRVNKQLQLIIVDDGSDEPTKMYLESFAKPRQWARIIRTEKGSGYTKAANRGLKASKADFMVLLNSDTVVTDGWSEKMTAALQAHPGNGIVGPMSSAASVQSIPDFRSSGGQTAINDLPKDMTIDDMNKFCERTASAELLPRVPLVHGFCFGLTRATINSLGYFDEDSFPRGYGEENDYCFRATDAGIGMVIATNTYVYHEKSKSYTNDEKRRELMDSGQAALRKKHTKQRIDNAVRSMVKHPILERMRKHAQTLY